MAVRSVPVRPAVADLRREVAACEWQAELAFRTLQNARTTIEEPHALLRQARERLK
jgi:DnaJ-domain-containing protein 1